jgi:hypothetical protein
VRGLWVLVAVLVLIALVSTVNRTLVIAQIVTPRWRAGPAARTPGLRSREP